MEYINFPFGKYKGTPLNELPSTYIVMALEKFDLPIELETELGFILLGRLNLYSSLIEDFNMSGSDVLDFLIEKSNKYETI